MGPIPNWALFDEALVPGWSTTASDALVELWESTFLGVTSYAGGQHAEMNATQPSILSQDFATLAGDEIDWTVAHRGRSGPDTADVRFGPPGAPTLVQVMTSPTGAWTLYSGTYVVPSGQATTQMSFAPQTSGSLGNFLDGIELALVCDISVTTTFAGFNDVDFSGHTNPGDTADFDYLVENLGTATVETLQVSDSLGFLATCPDTSLMPGESTTCLGTFALTSAEIDSGSVSSVATASAQDAEGVSVSDSDTVTEAIVPEPAIILDKSGSLNDSVVGPSGRVDAGDTIDYTLTVSNTGNVTLDPVSVTDATAGLVACPGTTLASGESMICTANLLVSQPSIDAGSMSNTASAEGTYGATVVSAVDNVTVLLEPAPDISLTKVGAIDNTVVAPVSRTDAGDAANFTIGVVNTGNVTLDPVVVSDPLAGAVTCGADSLAPGVTLECTASITLDQPAVDAGILTNTAVVMANPAGADPGDPGDDVTSSGTETLELFAQPLIGLAKSLERTVINPDGTIVATFRYTVANLGNVDVTDLNVTDDVVTLFASLSPTAFSTSNGTLTGLTDWDGTASSNLLAPGQSLAPGESGDVLGTFTVTASTEASIDNIATVIGTSPDGIVPTDLSTDGTDPDPDGDFDPTNNSDPTTLVVPRLYDLAVAKTARSVDPESSRIQWAITVTNHGPGDAPSPISVVEIAGAGLELESAGGAGWSCDMRGTSGTCTFDEALPVGGSSTIVVSSIAPVANRLVVSNTAVLRLLDTGDLDPSNNVAAASVVIGDLPFTGFGAALLVTAATILCTLGLVLVVAGRLEEIPRRRG